GAEPEARDTGAGPRTASSKRKEEGTVHHAPPPYQHRPAAAGVLRPEARRRPWHRRSDVAGLPVRPRAQSRGSARASPPGSIPGTAVPATVHSEAEWPATPPGGGRTGRQDRPASDHRGAERDLRGRFPRVLVRVPTEAQ